MEPLPFKPKVERRREIVYGTPGVVIYKNDKPFLWVPDNFSKITKNLSAKNLAALYRELKKYLYADDLLSSQNDGDEIISDSSSGD
jgi:hypothetical protein